MAPPAPSESTRCHETWCVPTPGSSAFHSSISYKSRVEEGALVDEAQVVPVLALVRETVVDVGDSGADLDVGPELFANLAVQRVRLVLSGLDRPAEQAIEGLDLHAVVAALDEDPVASPDQGENLDANRDSNYVSPSSQGWPG